jgi:hypothetical protein
VGEEKWHVARLIPTSGISGADEQERRATSALLAVMSAVPEFGRAVLKPFGAISGNIEVFIEVPFQLKDQRLFPDGLIRVTRGSKSWIALVEVKTSANNLAAQQIENYLDIAREQGFDAVITISNEIASLPTVHPTGIDKRKVKKVELHHTSWTQLLTEAVMQKVHRGISDPEQAWILGELIRYLEHPKSGALEFEDMGSAWTGVRDDVQTGTFRTTDQGAVEVCTRWDQLVRFLSLRMGRQLGVEVEPVIAKAELADPSMRSQKAIANLAKQSTLDGVIRIPGAIAPITITADLRAGQITAHIEIDAPKSGRPQTRVAWLTRQLQSASDDVRIDCFAMRGRGASTSELLKHVREDPKVLVADDKRDIKSFRIALSAPMGMKRGTGRGGFVQSMTDLLDEFYPSVVKTLKPWAAKAPAMRDEMVVEREPVQPSSLTSTAISSQDGPTQDGPKSDDEIVNIANEPVAVVPVTTATASAETENGESESRSFSLRWLGRK